MIYVPHVARSTILLSAVFFLGAINSNASASAEEWRPITSAELALRSSVVEPNTDAEAIFWDVRVDDTHDDALFAHYLRIKIFTALGCEQLAKVELPYYRDTAISEVAARTVAPDNSVVQVNSADIFNRVLFDSNGEKLSVLSFAFPRLEPGAIIEYKWKEVISKGSARRTRLQFQRDIPIQSVTYHIKPKHSFKGTFPILAFNMPTPRFEREPDGFYSTTVRNMAAFRPDRLMPPDETVRSWAVINYGLDSSEFGYVLIARSLYPVFQKLLEIDGDIKTKSAEIITGAETDAEKLERLFEFCRTNIKNTNDPIWAFTTEDITKENKKPADTLKRGVGNGLDIDLLFGALANAAGFDARVALLPDRSVTFFWRNRMVPGSLRLAAIAIVLNGNWKFFDPGVRYLWPGMLRWQEEDVDALIVDDPPRWARTPLLPPDRSKELRVAKLQISEDGTLEGDVTVEYSGHLARERKELNEDYSSSKREEELKASIQQRFPTAELTRIVIDNATDPIKAFICKYHIRVPDYASRAGKRMLLQPAFFEKGAPPLFPVANRKYGVYFHFPWSEEDTVTISLPNGFQVENIDKIKPVTAGPVARYESQIEVNGEDHSIVYHRRFFFGGQNRLYITPESYRELKLLFDLVNTNDNLAIAIHSTN